MTMNTETLESIATYVVSFIVVLGTYSHWFVKSWHGDPINPIITTTALFLTLAGAYVLFGHGTVSRAVGLLSDLRVAGDGENDGTDE